MKTLLKSKYLPLAALALGAVGFVLRKGLYAAALDHKNLLLPGHPLEIGLWVVTLLAILLAVVAARKAEDSGASKAVGAVGCAVLAVGILASVLLGGFSLSGLSLARAVLGLLAAVAMAAAAALRLKGKPVFFLFYGAVCIFFAVHMVSCYQGWSSNPQIQDYLYSLLSCVGLMLFAYQKTACAVNFGNRRLMLGLGLITVFACITALSGTEDSLLYLAGGIWAATNLRGE